MIRRFQPRDIHDLNQLIRRLQALIDEATLLNETLIAEERRARRSIATIARSWEGKQVSDTAKARIAERRKKAR